MKAFLCSLSLELFKKSGYKKTLPFSLLLSENAYLPLKYLYNFAVYGMDYIQSKLKLTPEKMFLCSVIFAIVNSAICMLCSFSTVGSVLWNITVYTYLWHIVWLNLVDIEGSSLLVNPYKVIFGLPNNQSYIAWLVQRFVTSSISKLNVGFGSIHLATIVLNIHWRNKLLE